MKNKNSIICFVLFISICFILQCFAGSSPVNILPPDRGIVEFMPVFPMTNAQEFIAFNKAISTDSNRVVIFSIPPEESFSNMTTRAVGFGPAKVSPLHRYTLRFRCNARYATDVAVIMTYKMHGIPVAGNKIYPHGGNLATPTMATAIEQDFLAPSGVDEAVVWFTVTGWNGRNPVPLGLGEKGEVVSFAELALYDRGAVTIPKQLRGYQGTNLLMVSDFENEPEGPFYPGPKVFVHKNFDRDNGITSEVVKRETKVLHLLNEKRYLYPHFVSQDIPFYNAALRFSFKARGKGNIIPTIWWQRSGIGSQYDPYPVYELKPEWQTITVEGACFEPTTVRAICAIVRGSDVVDMEIDDVSLMLVEGD